MSEERTRPKNADIVAEGVYLAAAVTRLKLKNSILMYVLAEGKDFDVDHFVVVAREALLALADEADQDAKRTDYERKIAQHRHSQSDGTHDYRKRDVRNLKRRRNQSRRVAQELRERADDELALVMLVLEAREAAWAEVASNIERSLDITAARPDRDADYAAQRAERIKALRRVDLRKLAKEYALREMVGTDSADASS
ncbi:asparagine synthase [Microbacterium sp.]|uniref:asparagine synthase n=1 Tax=Microbacterium sp. TaxID=51671 RepID=UPI0039E3A9B5